MAGMRTFASGATRNLDNEKYDYEGFLSPLVLERYGEYMHKHRHLPDGTLRESDNWQLGIEKKAYISSMWRHLIELWKGHRKYDVKEPMEESLCALIFNASGYLHELMKEKNAPQTNPNVHHDAFERIQAFIEDSGSIYGFKDTCTCNGGLNPCDHQGSTGGPIPSRSDLGRWGDFEPNPR